MTNAQFFVHAADLERGPRAMSWPLPEAWLRQVLAESGAEPQGDGLLEVEFSKNGKEVMVRGKARAQVTVPCVVTLDPLPFTLEPEIFLMLAPAPAEKTRPAATAKGTEGLKSKTAAPAKNKNPNARKSSSLWSLDPELSAADAARDTFDGERVVVDDFVREFLLLELPLFPRREDLPSGDSPAIAPPSAGEPAAGTAIDPRLMPLAAIANRLREQKKE